MVHEDLESKFKDPDDPFRLVFVCAMWLTEFRCPSCSTMRRLDKPMRNHTLMQTIARANRVFPNKGSGFLIVDYVGVFRNLERALAIYGADQDGNRIGEMPVQDKDELVVDLETAISDASEYLTGHDIDLDEIIAATGLEFVALRAAAAEALLIDDHTRSSYTGTCDQAQETLRRSCPEPEAMRRTARWRSIRSIARKIATAATRYDISDVMDSVSQLLDRSVGAEEYVIRTVGDPGSLFDLSTIDFEQLALQFGDKKRTAANHARRNIEQRIDQAVRFNPTRRDLAERFRRLLDEYNTGTHNIEEFLRRLQAINDELLDEEQRAVREAHRERAGRV